MKLFSLSLAINTKIRKSENFVIPAIKAEAVNNAIENTNLLKILNKYIAKPISN